MPAARSATYNAQRVESPKARIGATIRRVGLSTTVYDAAPKLNVYTDDGKRHPRSVLRFDSVSRSDGRGHPTQKPVDLLRWLVRSYSNPGDLVVDPFFGSGTTPEACALEGRRFFGCERDPDYFNFARKRIDQVRP